MFIDKVSTELALNVLGFGPSRIGLFRGVYPIFTDGYIHLIVLYKSNTDGSYDYRFVMRNKTTKKVIQSPIGKFRRITFQNIGGKTAEHILLDLYFAIL